MNEISHTSNWRMLISVEYITNPEFGRFVKSLPSNAIHLSKQLIVGFQKLIAAIVENDIQVEVKKAF